MKININVENPFGADRYGFLWEKLTLLNKGKHLDYGAFDGQLLKQLSLSRVISQGVGVDVNSSINKYAKTMPENVWLTPIAKGSKLPFKDESFDSVSILDVIEHIYDQKFVLLELNRVLKTGGKLIITVPHRHILSFLDLGNFKFIFPNLHRIFYTLKYSQQAYYQRYVECKNGLFGDIEIEKMWHQHFSKSELSILLAECGFKTLEFDGSGLFTRVLFFLDLLFPFKNKTFEKIKDMDDKTFHHVNLFCMAEKH